MFPAVRSLMKNGLISFICIALFACQTSNSANWPRNLPPLEYFRAAYQDDPVNRELQSERAYLGWIRDFYEGNLITPTGWLQVQAQVVAATPMAGRRQMNARLDALGAAIASEWAKENQERVIDSRMLALWGSVLQLAALDQRQGQAVTVIAADVDQLLARTLQGSAIRDARYERLLGLPLFGDF